MKRFYYILLIFTLAACPSYAGKNKPQLEDVFYSALEFVLTPDAVDLYRHMSDSARVNWANRFWRAMDPTPMTEANEYYEEYCHRVEYAFNYFHNLAKPYYMDDRGKYYVKYGKPDDFVESIGIGKQYKNNLTWAYYHLNLFVDFVERDFYGYEEVGDLSMAISGEPLNVIAQVASELYLERATLHQRYLVFRRLRHDHDFFSNVQKIDTDKAVALEEAPPVEYEYTYDTEPLTIGLSSSVFRGNNGGSRLELYYGIPLDEITFIEMTPDMYGANLKKSVKIYNDAYRPVVNNIGFIPLRSRPNEDRSGRAYINQHNEEIMPGNYHLAFQFENPESGRMSIYKAHLHIRDFPDDVLCLSDIQFARNIQENVKGGFVKANDILVIPYISNTVNQGTPIMIYFEVYNLLLNPETRSHFQVSYTLGHSDDSGNIITDTAAKLVSFIMGRTESSIGTSFETYGDSRFEQIYTTLDFSSSQKGNKKLTVTVKDLVSNEETSLSRTFRLQ